MDNFKTSCLLILTEAHLPLTAFKERGWKSTKSLCSWWWSMMVNGQIFHNCLLSESWWKWIAALRSWIRCWQDKVKRVYQYVQILYIARKKRESYTDFMLPSLHLLSPLIHQKTGWRVDLPSVGWIMWYYSGFSGVYFKFWVLAFICIVVVWRSN